MKKGIIAVASTFAGTLLGAGTVSKVMGEKLVNFRNTSDKHFAMFRMMNQWVRVKQAGKNLASYFEAKGYERIAVYGMSFVGETLLDELKGTGITVAYGIDRNADAIYADVDVMNIDDELAKVDVVVVTVITFFEEIEAQLSAKMDCPIISIEDALYEV